VALYQEIQLLTSKVISATGTGTSTTASQITRPYNNTTGFTSAVFELECTAVAGSGIVDIKVQGKTNNGANWFDLVDQNGKPIVFDTVSATGQQMLMYNGVVPSNLRANYTLVSGTSVTVTLNVALGG
jgi:hypothetical protein